MSVKISSYVFLVSCLVFSATPARAKLVTDMAEHIPGQLIIKLKEANPSRTSEAVAISSVITQLEQFRQPVQPAGSTLPGQLAGPSQPGQVGQLGQNTVLSVKQFQTDKTLHLIQLAKTSNEDMAAAIESLKKNPQIAFSEPNYKLKAYDDGIPNDPDFGKAWGLQNTGQADPGGVVGVSNADINIVPLWREGFTGSKKVLVAIIDTGIDWTHPDIMANLYTNPGEIAGNGVDDDHNGFVDDIHGWNFENNSPNTIDDHNHGTHCAGIIGAVGNNGEGVAGVNWNVSLMPVKFLDQYGGGSLDKAVEAVNYARMMKASILNNSWGGGAFSQTMFEAIRAARDAGILFVAAAGNDARDNDAEPSYPASYDVDNVLSVAATDNRDHLALFSNYGAQTVDVAAPGVRIWSTVKDGGYASLSGTSMAAPYATGVAALLSAAHPEMTYLDLRKRLIETSDPVDGLKGRVISGGRLDAYNAMHSLVSGRQIPPH